VNLFGKKSDEGKGRVKQQSIIQGIALQWLACAQCPSPPRDAGLANTRPDAFHQAARTSMGERGEESPRAE